MKDKKNVLVRLKRMEGQVKGIEKMILKEECCRKILIQVAAIRSAAAKIGAIILEDYCKECFTTDEEFSISEEKLKDVSSNLVKFITIDNLEEKIIDRSDKLLILKHIAEMINEVNGIIKNDEEYVKILDYMCKIKFEANKVGEILLQDYAFNCFKCAEKQPNIDKNIEELVSTLMMFTK